MIVQISINEFNVIWQNGSDILFNFQQSFLFGVDESQFIHNILHLTK